MIENDSQHQSEASTCTCTHISVPIHMQTHIHTHTKEKMLTYKHVVGQNAILTLQEDLLLRLMFKTITPTESSEVI